jgi:hypothetical protein
LNRVIGNSIGAIASPPQSDPRHPSANLFCFFFLTLSEEWPCLSGWYKEKGVRAGQVVLNDSTRRIESDRKRDLVPLNRQSARLLESEISKSAMEIDFNGSGSIRGCRASCNCRRFRLAAKFRLDQELSAYL